MELPKNVRNTDPESSKIAAEAHKRKRIKNIDTVLYFLALAGGPVTSRELFDMYATHFLGHGIDKYEVSRRLSDLKRLEGEAVELDLFAKPRVYMGDVRKCRVCGKKLVTYIYRGDR